MNKTAEQYIKENCLWIKYANTTKLSEPGPSGIENDVYFDVENVLFVRLIN